jgi:YYY domain-containing protein
VIGAIGATNTWDYPAYLGLSVLTLGLLAWRRWRDGQGFWRMVLLWLAWSIALVVMARVFFWPFNRSFATDYAGFEVYRGARTGALEFLKINGVWLFVLISAAFVLYRRVRNFSVGTLAITAVAMLAISAAVALRGLPAITLLLPLLGLAIGVLADLLFRSEELGRPRISTTTLMAVVWGVAGIGLVFLPEVIVAKGDIGRMNTVFKLGMQSWVLLALASAVGFVSLWRRLPSAARRPFLMGLWLLRAGSVGLIAAALVYPVTATPARIADRFDRQIGPTLDGTAYMRSPNSQWGENGRSFRFAEDATALDWMRRNITGSPVVLEAHTEAYRWAGRVSVYTGLPTIIGWPVHEIQQRSVAQVQPVLDSRRMLVQDLYNGTDPNEALRKLRLYGVEYVYVGELEQALYSPDGLAKFDTLAGQGLLEQVYSANTTRIYRVTEVQNPPAILTTSLPVVAPSLPPEKTAMLDRPVDRLPAVNEYAWNSLARSQPVAVALWLLALAILTALGLPLAVLVFGRWQDGGYTWAPLIGLLLLGYAVWLPVSAQLWQYNRLGLLLGTLLVLVVNGFVLAVLGRRARSKSLELKTGDQGSAAPRVSSNTAVNRGGSVAGGLRVVVAHLRAHWRQIVVVEALFLLAFSVLLVIRALNPDLWQPFWGGEKPFEFGFLNAILRSPVMPPYNPFYSGGTINYYYYGLYLVSLPVKATGIDPAIAFNLIIPTLFGLMVIGSFTLVRQLTKRVSYGLLGVLFVAVAGNYTAVFAVAGGYSAGLAPVGQALSDGFSEFGRRLDAWFVGPSRVIPYTINEFPFWSFLFADLHPHLIAMPITLLAIALAYSLFADQRRETAETVSSEGRRVVVGGRWALVALTLGALAVTNSWDFPTYALLTAGALVGAAWSNHRSTAPLVARVAGAVALTAGLAGTALLLYLPFFQNFNPMVGGIGVVRGGTQPIYYGVIYGLFLAVLVPAVVGALLRVAQFNTRRAALRSASFPDLSGETAVGFVAQPRFQQVPQRSAFIALAGITAAAVILAMLLASNPIALKLVLGFLLLGVAVLLLNRRLHPATWFALLLVLLGWAVSLGIDVVYIRDHLAGDPANPGDWYRMNTVFKFGLQVWILLALAAASLLPIGLRGLSRLHRSAPSLGMFGVALMTGLALVFALVGTPSRVAYRFPTSPGPTLDGLAFMKQATYDWYPCDGCTPFTISLKDDGEAIAWINQNITGTPVILQSSKEFYRAYGIRIAANTGLPTIVSPLHESEQRDPSLVADRDSDVITFYETASVDEALRLLSKYRVGYVYVGQIERAAYGEAGMAKFDQMNGSYLTTAYKNDTVTLYKVNEGVYSIAASQVESDVDPVSPQPQPDANPSAPEEVENPPGKPTLADLESRNQADPTLASVAFELALRYRDLGRFDDAAGVLSPATRANPNDVALHHLWGDILRDAGRLDEAEEAYRQAAVGNPTASNYNKLGSELLRMGRFDKAEAALIEATAIDSQEPEPYFQLGRVYEQLGKLPQALQSYKRYIELAPSGSFINDANEALARLQ